MSHLDFFKQIRVRRLFREDWRTAQRILDGDPDNPVTRCGLLPMLARDKFTAHAATVEQMVVGFALVYVSDKYVEMTYLGVLPEHRRRGVGRSLFLAALAHRSESRQIVQTLIPETNLPAQLFARSVGMKCTDTLRRANHDGSDVYFFLYQPDEAKS